MKQEGFINRLQEFVDKEQLSPSGLATRINMQRSTMSHLLSGRNKPSVELISKLVSEFDISADWLLFGKSVNKEPKQESKAPELPFIKEEEKPVYTRQQKECTSVNNPKTSMVILLKEDGTYERITSG